MAVHGEPRATQDLDFSAAWEDRVERAVGGAPIAFLGREALLANKRAAGRLKDLADVEALGG